jgi:ATP-dependent Lon protease
MAGFVGQPGTGKTYLARHLAKAIGIPFYQISFGGVKDASFFKGHGYTYVGSGPGEISKALISMGSKNGILFLDELDKIRNTPQGTEVASALLHILDYAQNHEFKDTYLSGIPSNRYF